MVNNSLVAGYCDTVVEHWANEIAAESAMLGSNRVADFSNDRIDFEYEI